MSRRVLAGLLAAFSLGALLSGCTKLRTKFRQARSDATRPAYTSVERPATQLTLATIYDGALSPGWQDWGWGNHELGHGPASIELTNYGGWILWNPALPSGVEALSFRMSAPSSFGDFLQIKLAYQKSDSGFPAVDIGSEHEKKLPDGWVEVYVPWSELDPSNGPVDQITLHARTSVPGDKVRFDKLILTAADPNAKPPPPARTDDVALAVDCRAAGHPISPYIYGVAGGDDPWELKPTARRWGGNRSTRYNWQLLVTNAGKDWFFENTKEGDYRSYLAEDRAHAAFTALTLPIAGWVAKDATSSGFPVSKFGPEHATDQWRPDAGDGIDKDGKPIRPGAPTQTSVPADPSFVAKWVEAIRIDDKARGARSVGMYILDNEPALWSANHRDIHPEGVSYDELLDRTVRYASAVRAADPDALIAGPAEWGWSSYFYSAKDLETSALLRPDRRAHGDVPVIPWYLARLREHEAKTGTRLLDVLDVHFYPQAANVYGNASDPATAALRIRSTRALWDPNYKDESWIADTVRLIPRLKEWVAENYPGRRISIGEYNFGGEQHMSGALAEAEALGRFGTEGLDYAFYWTFPPKNSPAYWAFRAYRDFDGSGAHFLEQSLPTKMSDTVSLFASRDASGKHLVLVALNLDPQAAARTHVELTGCSKLASSRAFVYTARSQALKPDETKTAAAFGPTLPPYSISVFDLALE